MSSRKNTRDRIVDILKTKGAININTLYMQLEKDGHGAHGSKRAISEIVYTLRREGTVEMIGSNVNARYKLAAEPPAVQVVERDRPREQRIAPRPVVIPVAQIDLAEGEQIEAEPSEPSSPATIALDDLPEGWKLLAEQAELMPTPIVELEPEPPAQQLDQRAIVIGPLAQEIAQSVALTVERHVAAELTKRDQRIAELSRGLQRKDEQIEQQRARIVELETQYCELQTQANPQRERELEHQVGELTRTIEQMRQDVEAAQQLATEAETKLAKNRELARELFGI